MYLRFTTFLALGIMGILLISTQHCYADSPLQKDAARTAAAPQQGQEAVERGLAFLEKDAQKWHKEHECSTCHHGAMTVWALSEAKSRGYRVHPESLAEMTLWTKTRFVPPPDQKPDPRPGFNIPSMAAVYLNMTRWANRESVSSEEADRIVKHITDRQEADGAWPTAPPANAPAPVFESRETNALWYCLALEPAAQPAHGEPSPAQASRAKADAWLKRIEPSDTTQNAALRLLIEARSNHASGKLRPAIKRLLDRQNADGGWSQIKTLSSDAYATGLSLYALSQAGVKNNRPEIKRACSFLMANQRADGSWPMIPRETPERKASKNIEPIVHIGSAWAIIGLVCSLPQPPLPSGQRDSRPAP